MRKIKLCSLVLLSTLLIGNTVSVFAGDSGYKDAPSITAGTYRKSGVYTCYASEPTAQVENTYVKFKGPVALASNFKSNNDRKLIVELWDQDPWNNPDDKLKIYTSKFKGRTPNLTFKVSNATGDTLVDDKKDNSAELYIKFHVGKIKDDPSDPKIASGLFKFKVGIK